VTPKPDPTQLSQVFYWIEPGTYTVEYEYQTDAGSSERIKASFDVVGPTGTLVPSSLLGQTDLLPTTSPTMLQCGADSPTADSPPCVGFSAPLSNPTGYSNATQEFVQVIGKATDIVVTETASSQKQRYSCSAGPGLDSTYPYNSYIIAGVPQTYDVPRYALYPASTTGIQGTPISHTVTFKATIYALWQADENPTTIPVPLGYATWVWQAQATLKHGTWTITPGSVHLTVKPVTARPAYPIWQVVDEAVNSQCNATGQ